MATAHHNDNHENKYEFRTHELLSLLDLIISDQQHYQNLWIILRMINKLQTYFIRPQKVIFKINQLVRKVFQKDGPVWQFPDTYKEAFQRKSLDHLGWLFKENSAAKGAADIERVLTAQPYKGIVIYPTTIPWEPLQRPQQLMRELARAGYLCLYCEPFETNFRLVNLEENLYTVSGEEYLLVPLRQRQVIVLCTWMMNLPFVNMLQDYVLWYDIIDRLEIFSLYDEKMLEKHWQVVAAADIVSYSAQNLAELVAGRGDALYLPNGVIVEDFLQEQTSSEADTVGSLISIIKRAKKPLIGFYGAIAEWVDLKLVRQIAEVKNEWEFVFIGKTWTNVDSVKDLPNVHLVGPVLYHSLPQYAKFFDIAIVPFVVNELTNSVSPIKFFEYAALGLPIVTTPFYEIIQYADKPFIRVAGNGQAMIAAIQDLLTSKSVLMAEEARQFAWENHWRERIHQIIDRLTQFSP